MNENKKPFPERKRNRLKEFDYSNDGYYFITICVDEKECCFGTVESSNAILNEYGEIIKTILTGLNEKYKCCEIDYYIIMPNHIHFIMIIDNSKSDVKCSVPQIIGGFKSITTIELHKKGLTNFKWQRSYYDRIIRNEKELYYIRQYIEQNPLRWGLEKDNPENLELM
ncbi:Transposase [Ignavibacterium album JCM 16511]|uniref:Transposase n=1 Tax=Ignavibacterium album (strain DSM 19864 / JCM 16511 / NBRC 101810 / Mat9-16) TaxID=945713 RepID=I0ANP9_IGNAJ|nr:transposase [Ignavibacterium album]AFH50606.1 Transposase [Ignavibacterium album JCM 16511]